MSFRLEPHARLSTPRGPVLVVVMDGVGIGPDDAGNAVRLARTPTLDHLAEHHPTLSLRAHGKAVGLPSDGDMGNSEVGHNALGAGRVFAQGAKLVNAAIASGAIFEGTAWKEAVNRAKAGGALHLLGLLSDGNVHSHIDHLFALIDAAHRAGVTRLFVHALLDGRDVPERSALGYIDALEAKLSEYDGYQIASGGGRMKVTMDRYGADWGMVELGWKTHVRGEGETFPSARAAVEALRERDPDVTDQYLGAFVIGDPAEPGRAIGPIVDGDSVIFFNFRGDRGIEISRAFDEEDLSEFDRGPRPDVSFAGMMEYDGDYHIPKKYLVEPPAIERTMGEYLAKNGVRQFACSETQKFGHVTYFWNGNRSGKFDDALEEYVEIPSDNVDFSERPWMKAAQITDRTIEAIESGEFGFLRINYANGDMVGHTGRLDAAVLAVETVDLCLARLLRAMKAAGGIALITADHGNADEMFAKGGSGSTREPKTSHTLNQVPLYLFAPGRKDLSFAPNDEAGLANVAATVLNLLGYEAPDDYEASLLSP